MAHIDDYNAELDKINAYQRDEVIEPNMPIDEVTQEAEDLYNQASKDKAELQTGGLNISLIDALPIRAGALRYAQALWMKDYDTRQDAETEWKQKLPLAQDLHGELLHYFRYAYRNDPEMMKKVHRIAEGSGHRDMIQDFIEIAVLGKANPEPLQAVGLDLSKLDRAETYSDELTTLLAQVNGVRNTSSEIKEIRDRTYTHLKKAMDEVRDCGKFVFWREPEKVEKYYSRYFRKQKEEKKQKVETL